MSIVPISGVSDKETPEPKKNTGCKGKYNAQMLAMAKRLAESGLSDTGICGRLKISKETFYQWIKNKPDFSDAIKEARALVEEDALDAIRSHFHENWQAAAWYLERRDWNTYGKRHLVAADPKENKDVKELSPTGSGFQEATRIVEGILLGRE